MSKNPLASQIDELIDQVVFPMESSRVEYISPDAVAMQVVELIDSENISPSLMKYASVMHVKQRARQKLAKRHDPVEKAGEYMQETTNDLFGDELQPYYPVRREGERLYAKREVLVETDIEIICSRMEKAGMSLLGHSRALRAWFTSGAA